LKKIKEQSLKTVWAKAWAGVKSRHEHVIAYVLTRATILGTLRTSINLALYFELILTQKEPNLREWTAK